VLAVVTAAIRVGSRTGSGRKISASAKLNMAEVAPIPMASEQMLTSVNPGAFSNSRRAWRKDFSIDGTDEVHGWKVQPN
jgi:hypothetical protein